MKILVCNPAHYDVSYKINPWMDPESPTDKGLAFSQWATLVETIQKCGAEVIEMSGQPGLPDMVFTANAGTVHDNKVVLSNFFHAERQLESEFFRHQFDAMGMETIDISGNYEGAGDALIGHGVSTGNTLWCGVGRRSDGAAHDATKRALGLDVCHLNLADPYFYHLDTCFCPLRDDQALIYCSAFDKKSYDMLRWCFYLIEVPSNEARRFACNAICIERNVILPDGCPETRGMLEGAGYAVFECPMSEFIKSGGACKCLSLRI